MFAFAPIAPTQDMLDTLHTEGYNAKLFIKGGGGTVVDAKLKLYAEDIDHIPAVRRRLETGDRWHAAHTCWWRMNSIFLREGHLLASWMMLEAHVGGESGSLLQEKAMLRRCSNTCAMCVVALEVFV